MKKLFLKSGKLMVGDFPEEPIPVGSFIKCKEVDPGSGFWKALLNAEGISTGEGSEQEIVWAINSLQEGRLYDLPVGWTVEIDETCKWDGNKDACGNESCWDMQECQKSPVKKIARLVPDLSILETCFKTIRIHVQKRTKVLPCVRERNKRE